MYQIFVSNYFKKQIKPYLKKHRSLWDDVVLFLEKVDLSLYIHVGRNLYKARLQISDVNKGKRNSFRIIILLIQEDNLLAPVAFYYKGDKKNISKKELKIHITQVQTELDLQE